MRKAETGSIQEVGGAGGKQANSIDCNRMTEVNLDPLLDVRLGLDAAVIAVARACDLSRQRRQHRLTALQLRDLAIESNNLRAGESGNRFLKISPFGEQFAFKFV